MITIYYVMLLLFGKTSGFFRFVILYKYGCIILYLFILLNRYPEHKLFGNVIGTSFFE